MWYLYIVFKIPLKCSGKNLASLKPLEDSSPIYDEREDLYFLVSQFKDKIKWSMKMVGLLNWEERMMGNIAKIIQNSEDNLPIGDDVFQVNHEDKDNVYVEKPFTNKNVPRGTGSSSRSSLG